MTKDDIITTKDDLIAEYLMQLKWLIKDYMGELSIDITPSLKDTFSSFFDDCEDIQKYKWQPMETAPKSGIDILGCCNREMAVIYFKKEHGYAGRWAFSQSEIDVDFVKWQPIKWQPLPKVE